MMRLIHKFTTKIKLLEAFEETSLVHRMKIISICANTIKNINVQYSLWREMYFGRILMQFNL